MLERTGGPRCGAVRVTDRTYGRTGANVGGKPCLGTAGAAVAPPTACTRRRSTVEDSAESDQATDSAPASRTVKAVAAIECATTIPALTDGPTLWCEWADMWSRRCSTGCDATTITAMSPAEIQRSASATQAMLSRAAPNRKAPAVGAPPPATTCATAGVIRQAADSDRPRATLARRPPGSCTDTP